MPSPEYLLVLDGLAADPKRAIEDVLVAWSTDAAFVQVSWNITNETALAAPDFSSLLDSFASRLTAGSSPKDSWLAACRAHKLKGSQLPVTVCPEILGRAKGLEDHAVWVAKASGGGLTPAEAKRLLIKYSGAHNPTMLHPFLRETPLGKYNLVWATFDQTDPNANPFARLPVSRDAICAALGLGGITDTLILLVWNHADSGSPPLHRPTVADAEDYRFYRPRPDARAFWGLTEPLPPNPDGLAPQPEVVMPDPTSRGLRLPFSVV